MWQGQRFLENPPDFKETSKPTFEDKTGQALNFQLNDIMSPWFHLVPACSWWEGNSMQLHPARGMLWFITI